MRTTRIELEGSAGSVAITREQDTIRIDSIMRNVPAGEEVWKTLEIPARIDDGELFKIAEEVQRRCDGGRGTNSDVYGYFAEMQRFQG